MTLLQLPFLVGNPRAGFRDFISCRMLKSARFEMFQKVARRYLTACRISSFHFTRSQSNISVSESAQNCYDLAVSTYKEILWLHLSHKIGLVLFKKNESGKYLTYIYAESVKNISKGFSHQASVSLHRTVQFVDTDWDFKTTLFQAVHMVDEITWAQRY